MLKNKLFVVLLFFFLLSQYNSTFSKYYLYDILLNEPTNAGNSYSIKDSAAYDNYFTFGIGFPSYKPVSYSLIKINFTFPLTKQNFLPKPIFLNYAKTQNNKKDSNNNNITLNFGIGISTSNYFVSTIYANYHIKKINMSIIGGFDYLSRISIESGNSFSLIYLIPNYFFLSDKGRLYNYLGVGLAYLMNQKSFAITFSLKTEYYTSEKIAIGFHFRYPVTFNQQYNLGANICFIFTIKL